MQSPIKIYALRPATDPTVARQKNLLQCCLNGWLWWSLSPSSRWKTFHFYRLKPFQWRTVMAIVRCKTLRALHYKPRRLRHSKVTGVRSRDVPTFFFYPRKQTRQVRTTWAVLFLYCQSIFWKWVESQMSPSMRRRDLLSFTPIQDR